MDAGHIILLWAGDSCGRLVGTYASGEQNDLSGWVEDEYKGLLEELEVVRSLGSLKQGLEFEPCVWSKRCWESHLPCGSDSAHFQI
ncbi:hypothetical protein NL676_006253 [Syzygium grande]|nr:hypothetical protein NL676_006253 [Syzygium grande]